MQSISTQNVDLIDEISTKINYLISAKNLKTLLIYSENKSEGKTTCILNIAPSLCNLYKKRVLILDHSDKSTDSLENLLEANEVADEIILKTKYSGVDYIRQSALDDKNIKLNDLTSFYDLVLVNTTNYNDESKISIPPITYDGAILVRTNNTLGNKVGKNSKNVLDINIPIVGIILNEGNCNVER